MCECRKSGCQGQVETCNPFKVMLRKLVLLDDTTSEFLAKNQPEQARENIKLMLDIYRALFDSKS